MSPGVYIFQRPFLRGLCAGEICVSESIGLVYGRKEIYRFCFVSLFYEGNFQVQASAGAYIRRGDLTEGFLCDRFRGRIHEGAYFRNFT